MKNTNGSYIVNGDWKFSTSRIIQGAGTKFVYVRQDDNSLESISSSGPLANSVDILVIHVFFFLWVTLSHHHANPNKVCFKHICSMQFNFIFWLLRLQYIITNHYMEIICNIFQINEGLRSNSMREKNTIIKNHMCIKFTISVKPLKLELLHNRLDENKWRFFFGWIRMKYNNDKKVF